MANHATAGPATAATTPAAALKRNPYIERARDLVEADIWDSITVDADVYAAFEGLAETYRQPARGRIPALRLLNTISLTYFNYFGDAPPPAAAVFSWDTLTHDYFRGFSEPLSHGGPSWISFSSTIDQLCDTVDQLTKRPDEHTQGSRDCSHSLSAGECRFRPVNGGQLGYIDWFINTIQRCRPDLSAVHGLQFYDDSMRLSTFDAGGIFQSGILPIRTLDAWVAHVVMVYESIWNRDSRFTYLGPGEHTARWGFKTGANDGIEVCLEPFFASPSAGRRTWAAYTTCRHAGQDARRHEQNAIGFFKVAWQPRRGRLQRSEGELLEIAHARSWLPGLVRHWGHWQGDASGTVVYHEGRPREKEILHIGSIGQPMSRCLSVQHILKVFFDATRVLQELDERGILHRDPSGYNVLCNPKHDPALLQAYPDKPVASAREVPCIDYILTGDDAKEPCALVTDLDLSVVSKSDEGKTYQRIPGGVGTPKFFSVEACSLSAEPLLPPDRSGLDELLDKLRIVDSSPTMRGRMFPKGEDEGFIEFVTRIFDLEVARGTAGTTSPDVGYLPRHDIESLFWGLFWALARACPLGGDPLIDVDGEFREFVNAMLRHDFGYETRRPYFTAARFERVLHPGLRQFAPLLTNMLRYLSIPWHLHAVHADEYLGRYHAHIAMQRLLFAEIDNIGRLILDVLLDTEQPRLGRLEADARSSTNVTSEGEDTATSTVAASPGGSTPTAAAPTPHSGPASDAAEATNESHGHSKRKRADWDECDDEDDCHFLKRPREDLVAQPKLSYYICKLAEFFRIDRRFWFGVTKETVQEAKDEWLFTYKRKKAKNV